MPPTAIPMLPACLPPPVRRIIESYLHSTHVLLVRCTDRDVSAELYSVRATPTATALPSATAPANPLTLDATAVHLLAGLTGAVVTAAPLVLTQNVGSIDPAAPPSARLCVPHADRSIHVFDVTPPTAPTPKSLVTSAVGQFRRHADHVRCLSSVSLRDSPSVALVSGGADRIVKKWDVQRFVCSGIMFLSDAKQSLGKPETARAAAVQFITVMSNDDDSAIGSTGSTGAGAECLIAVLDELGFVQVWDARDPVEPSLSVSASQQTFGGGGIRLATRFLTHHRCYAVLSTTLSAPQTADARTAPRVRAIIVCTVDSIIVAEYCRRPANTPDTAATPVAPPNIQIRRTIELSDRLSGGADGRWIRSAIVMPADSSGVRVAPTLVLGCSDGSVAFVDDWSAQTPVKLSFADAVADSPAASAATSATAAAAVDLVTDHSVNRLQALNECWFVSFTRSQRLAIWDAALPLRRPILRSVHALPVPRTSTTTDAATAVTAASTNTAIETYVIAFDL